MNQEEMAEFVRRTTLRLQYADTRQSCRVAFERFLETPSATNYNALIHAMRFVQDIRNEIHSEERKS